MTNATDPTVRITGNRYHPNVADGAVRVDRGHLRTPR
jgi:hypothetical protein